MISDEVLDKVFNYFRKYTSVGVLRALEDLYTMYGIDPVDGMRAINRLIEMGIVERVGDIYDGVLNYTFKHGERGDSGVVMEFEADAVRRVVEVRKKRIIDWKGSGSTVESREKSEDFIISSIHQPQRENRGIEKGKRGIEKWLG